MELAALAVLLALPLQAQGPAACRQDMEELCADAPDPMACMKENIDELSPACRAAFGRENPRGKGGKAKTKGKSAGKGPDYGACKGDLGRYCAKVKPGANRLSECLRANEKKLAKACRQAMKDHHAKMESGPDAAAKCTQDAQDLCPDMMPGDGSLSACLKEHDEELSEPCAKVFAKGRAEMEKRLGALRGGD